jgi:26S proteasome regulatory subunit N9
MSPEERLQRSHDLSIAALLADTIYNFGELVRVNLTPKNYESDFESPQLMHPILDSLNGNEHEWLKKLMFTFNEGNIGKFEALAPLFPKEVNNSISVSKLF